MRFESYQAVAPGKGILGMSGDRWVCCNFDFVRVILSFTSQYRAVGERLVRVNGKFGAPPLLVW